MKRLKGHVKQIKSNKVFNFVALVPAIVGAASAAFMAYVFWWPPTPAYQVDRPKEHSVSYVDGQIRVHRAYCSHDEIPVTISRDLIRIGAPGEVELRIALPQTTQVYSLGCHEIDRIFDVPRGTPSGNYRLVHIATWQANLFRDAMVKLPELYIAIPKTELLK